MPYENLVFTHRVAVVLLSDESIITVHKLLPSIPEPGRSKFAWKILNKKGWVIQEGNDLDMPSDKSAVGALESLLRFLVSQYWLLSDGDEGNTDLWTSRTNNWLRTGVWSELEDFAEKILEEFATAL